MARTKVRNTQMVPEVATDDEVIPLVRSLSGVANGIAPLDSGGKVPLAHLPASAQGSGVVVQSISQAVTPQSGTSVVSLNNTLPTTSSGTLVWTASITPARVTSKVNISGSFIVDASGSRHVIAMVFRGSVCVGVSAVAVYGANRPTSLVLNLPDNPGSTSVQTYTVRLALATSGTWYAGQGASPYFAGMLARSIITLSEIA